MKIEIKHRFTGEIIVAGKYDSLKDAAEKSRADLRRADLCDADLRDAELDFSVLSFSCCSLACKTDEKQRIQLMFHALSWMAHAESITDEEKAIYNFALDYANKFHRTDVARLIKKED
mgnify:CR=1 FL=1